MCFFLSGTTTDFISTLAHAGAGTMPVPHWVVLIIGVVFLWVVIGGGVVALDGLLVRFSDR